MDDRKVYQLIASGDCLGIFQLESRGMMRFMKELAPEHFEDIIAGISLYRPGPMDQIPRYLANKKDPDHITYTHESLRPILNVTYGCMVYQEQVMQIFRDLAGFSMGRSDLVRRAMSKKKSDVMDAEGEVFIHGEKDENGKVTVPGAVANGIPEAAARKIYDEMKDFAKYAFNKSHAAAYAVIAYQTAWLKCHYPAAFMAALMSSVMDNEKKVANYIANCRQWDIRVLPPDVNSSGYKYSVEGHLTADGKHTEAIRMGLGSIKGVGPKPAEMIAAEREKNGAFKGFRDFCERVDLKSVNRKVISNLILSGAFDFVGVDRSRMLLGCDLIIKQVTEEKEDHLSGQISLIDIDGDHLSAYKGDTFPENRPFTEEESLAYEKDALGFYISGHPLAHYAGVLASETNLNAGMLDSYEDLVDSGIADGGRVCVGGLIDRVRVQLTKRGDQMAFVMMEDMIGSMEIVVFPDAYARCRSVLQEGSAVLVHGQIRYNEEMNVSIIANQIELLANVRKRRAPQVREKRGTYFAARKHVLKIRLPDYAERGVMRDIKPVLRAHRGSTPVVVYFEKEQKKYEAAQSLWVAVNDGLVNQLKGILGEDSVKVV